MICYNYGHNKMGERVMSEILQYNMKQLLKTFGCENLYQFEKKREMIQKDGFAFPSKNTMVKLLNPETNGRHRLLKSSIVISSL